MHFGALIRDSLLRPLILGVLPIPPGHALTNLLESHILAINPHHANRTSIAIQLATIGNGLTFGCHRRQAGFGAKSEVLAFFRGIDPRQADLVLNVLRIEQG